MLLASLILAACVTQPSPSGSPDPTPPSATSSVQAMPGEATFFEQWRARLPEAMAEASAFERRLLADGVVTEAEHEVAIINHLDCIRRAGLRVVELKRAPSGMIASLGVTGGTGDGEDPVLKCQAEFYTFAREGYRGTTFDPDGTDAERLRAVARCIRGRGITVPPEPTDMDEITGVIHRIAMSDHTNERNAQGIFGDCLFVELY